MSGFHVFYPPVFPETLICLLVTVSASEINSGVLSLLSSFLHPSLSISLSMLLIEKIEIS